MSETYMARQIVISFGKASITFIPGDAKEKCKIVLSPELRDRVEVLVRDEAGELVPCQDGGRS